MDQSDTLPLRPERQLGSDLHCYKSQARQTHVSGVVINRSDALWILCRRHVHRNSRRRLECVGGCFQSSKLHPPCNRLVDRDSEPKAGAEIADHIRISPK